MHQFHIATGAPTRICKLYNYLTTRQTDGHQITLGGLDLALQEALLFVRYPACLFAIVRLALVDTLLFKRNEQVRSRIGVFALLYNWLRHFRRANETFGLVETRERCPGAFLQHTRHVSEPTRLYRRR